jgi:NAD(P)-dependent dehydrogenase (short-subunit alcohol dehydrogenase family)
MAGLVPAIHVLLCSNREDMDALHKAGHDERTPGTALMTIRFDGRVAIVTGAGNGLGRAHALGLASRGAKVVVNDFGGARDGSGGSLSPAETVVEEIRNAGGIAMADGADVSNFEQVTAMVERATREWGSVDLLCANAGILRDKSFAKMEVADWAKVLDVHLTGTFYCCKAVWAGMRERNYGRVVLTTSSSGLFGNFGQANYGAAKAGMVGLMNVLAEEGRKNNIKVNIVSPTAATRMTEELLPPQALGLMKPEAITPAVEFLLSEDAPTRTIMGAGAGSFAVIRILETEGVNLARSDWTPDAIAAHFAEISDMSTAKALQGAFEQTQKYVGQAAARAGIKL